MFHCGTESFNIICVSLQNLQNPGFEMFPICIKDLFPVSLICVFYFQNVFSPKVLQRGVRERSWTFLLLSSQFYLNPSQVLEVVYK